MAIKNVNLASTSLNFHVKQNNLKHFNNFLTSFECKEICSCCSTKFRVKEQIYKMKIGTTSLFLAPERNTKFMISVISIITTLSESKLIKSK